MYVCTSYVIPFQRDLAVVSTTLSPARRRLVRVEHDFKACSMSLMTKPILRSETMQILPCPGMTSP